VVVIAVACLILRAGLRMRQAGNFRRAADAFGQLRTLSSRLLGSGHKHTVAATSRAKAAAARAATTPLAHHRPAAHEGLAGGGGGGDGTRSSPLRKAASPAETLTGEESWLN
jgi:hypothetical protein